MSRRHTLPDLDEVTMLSNVLSWLVIEAKQHALRVFGKQDMAHWEHDGRKCRVFAFRDSPVTPSRLQVTVGPHKQTVDSSAEAIDILKKAMGLADGESAENVSGGPDARVPGAKLPAAPGGRKKNPRNHKHSGAKPR